LITFDHIGILYPLFPDIGCLFFFSAFSRSLFLFHLLCPLGKDRAYVAKLQNVNAAIPDGIKLRLALVFVVKESTMEGGGNSYYGMDWEELESRKCAPPLRS